MRDLFIAILNMSLSASFVAIVVMLLRLTLKRTPKIFSYMLWAVALFRLLCPISFESAFSLLAVKPDAVPQDIVYAQNPAIESGVGFMDNAVNGAILNSLPPVRSESSVNPMCVIIDLGTNIWLIGILILVGYGTFSYLRLQRRLDDATLAEENIYETDRISTPFVMGFLRPRIYLPCGIAAEERDYILRHEQTHIRRRDYLIKPLGFLTLTLHWFNPLVWLSYRLMCRDMEMSCDEGVIGQYGEDIRAKYSGSLLSLSMKQSGLLAPLAFGEPDAKSRIKNVLNYKKPAFWISVVAVIVLVVAGFCLLANPRSEPSREKSYAERLLQYRTEYVGDNSKVAGIASELEYPERVGYNYIQLFTGSPPLSVTVRLDTDTDTRNFYTGESNQVPFMKNAILMFALIGNVEYVSFELDDGVHEPYLIQHTRQWAENYVGGALWEYSGSELSLLSLLTWMSKMPDAAPQADYQSPSKQESPPTEADPYADAVAQANEDREEILNVLQDKIQQYRDGKVINNELEPRFDALPEGIVIPNLVSADSFIIEPGNEMFPVRVTLEMNASFVANFYLSRMGPRAEEIANGLAKEDDYIWAVNAVGIYQVKEPEYNFFTVPEMTAGQQVYYDGYVNQILYTSLLMRDWSPQDYSELSVDHAGSAFANYLILAFEDITGSEEMQRLFNEYNGDFPAKVIEDVLLTRFPFTAEQLHEILSYHYRADTNTYYYEGGRGGGPIEAAVVDIRTQGDFVYLDYEFYNGFSGLDGLPETYLYKTPGVLTLQRKFDGSYLYYAVDVGEQEEAPPKTQAN